MLQTVQMAVPTVPPIVPRVTMEFLWEGSFDTTEEMAQMGEQAAIAPFGDPAATHPNLYVKPSHDARPCGHEGLVANPLEV